MSETIQQMIDRETSPSLAVRVGGRMRDIRKSKGLTLKNVGDRCDTSGQSIQRLETGNMTLSIDWIERISAALGIEPRALFGDDDVMLQQLAERQIYNEARNLRFYARAVIERVDKFLEAAGE
jgi:transcriptional regulator with XRE-family HTH domain